jgi:Putative zinc-finger
MDCDAASERLPWLYAGSLAPEEAAELRRHLEGCPRCLAEMDETRRAAAIFDAHLPTAVVLDLAWDRPVVALPADVVRAHLESCAACGEDLALGRESRLLEGQGPGAATVLPLRPAARSGWRVAALPATLAAGLAVGALWGRGTARPQVQTQVQTNSSGVSALETEVARLRQAVSDLEARASAGAGPRLNLPIFELIPGALIDRGAPVGGNDVAVPADAAEIALFLTAEAPAAGGASLVLKDGAGREVWRADGLRYGPPGGYVVTLPASLLPDGAYVVTVRPARGKDAAYHVRVRRAR